jgi:hypothetical protein
MIAFILMFIISCFLGPDGFTSFIYIFLSSYVGHVVLHDDLFYYLPYSILHRYHHEIHSPFSYFINILSELSQLTLALFLLPLNPWSMLYGALMFVTIHYINYSWLHINTYHEKHHENVTSNMSPDIIDVVFGTKHPDTPFFEDTTHMIPNVILCALFVFWLKQYYTPSWKRYFCYISSILILLLSTTAFIIKNKT